MPTYVYRREDGSTFEIEQRISEPALEVDPETGQRVTRVITGAGLVFRGSGFYLTDYARKGAAEKASAEKPASEAPATDSKAAGETESKPAPQAEAPKPTESKPAAPPSSG